jgi:hypothetical protein
MKINLGRGLWRVWLFFTLIWVSVFAWNVFDANSQATKAESLLAYYKDSALAAKKSKVATAAFRRWLARIITNRSS